MVPFSPDPTDFVACGLILLPPRPAYDFIGAFGMVSPLKMAAGGGGAPPAACLSPRAADYELTPLIKNRAAPVLWMPPCLARQVVDLSKSSQSPAWEDRGAYIYAP